MIIEFEDDDGELAHILKTLAGQMQHPDEKEATPEDVAEDLLRQAAAQKYQQLVSQGQL